MEIYSFMKREQMNYSKTKEQICRWLIDRVVPSGANGFVVGVSGGIDSAVTSTLCAYTGYPVFAVAMPIDSNPIHYARSLDHIDWLIDRFPNVGPLNFDLEEAYGSFADIFTDGQLTELADANLQSRLRMCCLYAIANSYNCLVVGTGNKVEDYGIGFFTKYGDGGVDLSPIADLLKSEVRAMGETLGVAQEIIDSAPTDGLWGDGRTDEEQIGATYEELEWALFHHDSDKSDANLSKRKKEVLEIYRKRHLATKHKLEAPPVCYINKDNQ
jgi:NAD+ synthase